MMALSLVLISVACGLAVAWIYRGTADRDAVRLARKHVYAHLLEFRLFADDPQLVFRAQLALIAANARLLVLLLPPLLISAVPLAWIALQLDAVYGTRPLAVGQAAIVTAQMETDAIPSLQAPPGILVETPPVRELSDQQVSWRIRATEAVRGDLRLTWRGETIEKTVSAGDRTVFLLRRRVHPFLQFLLQPEESRVQTAGVEWVEVDYPKAESWILWFLAISTVSALVFDRYA
jgi:hypothetical protein